MQHSIPLKSTISILDTLQEQYIDKIFSNHVDRALRVGRLDENLDQFRDTFFDTILFPHCKVSPQSTKMPIWLPVFKNRCPGLKKCIHQVNLEYLSGCITFLFQIVTKQAKNLHILFQVFASFGQEYIAIFSHQPFKVMLPTQLPFPAFSYPISEDGFWHQ